MQNTINHTLSEQKALRTKKMKQTWLKNIAVSCLSVEDMQTLDNLGLPIGGVGLNAMSADVHTPFSKYHGLAYNVPSGWIDFVDLVSLQETILTERRSDIMRIGQGEARICYVFVGMLDYLAFLGLRQSFPSVLPVLDRADVFLLGGASNFFSLASTTDVYEQVGLFFPKSDFGGTMRRTMLARNPRHVVTYDGFFGEARSLFEFYQHLRRK